MKDVAGDGWDGDDEDEDKDLLDQLIAEETSRDPEFPRKLEEEVQLQRQVRETREELATQPVVSLEDWRNSRDGEQARVILGKLRARKRKSAGEE